jgi:hypothetical protein
VPRCEQGRTGGSARGGSGRRSGERR